MTRKPYKLDIRYFAGLFDGEGSISVNCQKLNGKIYHKIVLQLSMTDRQLLYSIHKTYKGGLFILKRKTVTGLTAYHWSACGPNARDLLQRLLPHLKTKKRQALLALEFFRTVHKNRRFSKREYNKRKEINRKILYLNATT